MKLDWTQDPWDKRAGNILVTVDTQKFDSEWQKDKGFYLAHDGSGENYIGNRYFNIKKWMDGDAKIKAPSIGLAPNNSIPIFGDGRHRFAVLRDMGVKHITISIDPDDLKKFQTLFDAKPYLQMKEAYSLNVPPQGKTEKIWWMTAMGQVEHFVQWCMSNKTTQSTWRLQKPASVLLSMSWNNQEQVSYQFKKIGYPKIIASGTLDISHLFRRTK